MTAQAETGGSVVVTQADVEATDALDDALGFLTDRERPKVLQAFARHAKAAREDALREAAAIAHDHVERARKIISGAKPWGQVQGEWSRARDLGLDILDDLSALARGEA